MEKQLRTITRIQIVLGMLSEILFENSNYTYLTFWFLMNAYWFFSIRFTMMLYSDVKNIFPYEKAYKPDRFENLFEKLYGSKRIPKSFIWQIYFIVVLFCISTVLFLVLGIKQTKEIALETALVFVVIALMIFIYVYYSVYLTIFLERFKRINKYNIRYALFFSYNRTLKWPISKKIGRCNVIEYELRKGKTYVTVKMVDSEEIYKHVIAVSEIKNEGKRQYKLYEICHEKYITL